MVIILILSAMLQYLKCFISIGQLLIFINAEPLIGQRVVPANPHEFPFIASLGIYQSGRRHHFCTGSLISQQQVLTAAHCLKDLRVNQIDVIVGDVDLMTSSSTRYHVNSCETYDSWALDHGKPIEFSINDVAILKLSSPVNREGVVPASLTHLCNDQQLFKTDAVMIGWGITNENSLSHGLLKGKVRILNPEQCADQVKLITAKRSQPKENYLCTLADPYVLASHGDSGGPLLDKDNFLLGIVRSVCPKAKKQWGNFSTEFLNQYRVCRHSSVNYYREFIESAINVTKCIHSV